MRWLAEASGGSRCGGCAFGISQTSRRPAWASSPVAACRCPLCTGSKVPPMTPVGLPGSAIGIVDELQLTDPDGLAAPGAVPGQRLVEPPAIDRPLEVGEPFRVGEIGHRHQLLQLVAGYREAAVDALDGEGFGRAGTAIDLQRRERVRRFARLTMQRPPRRPEQIWHAL